MFLFIKSFETDERYINLLPFDEANKTTKLSLEFCNLSDIFFND